ncbi:MAG: hypothetical protein JHC98_08180 [Thermoleophilaceae bacterium]|nr:hypothetical protein [Thermoleophilaceae bacterium]
MISRKGLTALLASAVACLAIAPAAGAAYTATPYGGTTDTTVGGHGDLTTGATFSYGNNTTDTIRRVLIDTPAGGVGNPNAVPYADRCTKETFETGICDVKSQIGVVTISAKAWVIPGLISIPLDNMTGTISEIQTDPEVPTLIGAYIEPPLGADKIRAYARFYPVTSGPDGDFRIRSETDPFPTKSVTPLGTYNIQITKYEQKLFGTLANGNVFITNPTRCDTWNSWGYAEFYNDNSTANWDPFQTGTNNFTRTDAVPTEPNCSTPAPFTATADASVQGATRGAPATFTTELKIPGLEAVPQSAAVPKTVVATLPDALNVDVKQLGRICSNADFAARNCPASTKVGDASIATPMIVAGLQGDAHLVQASPGHNLPDLGIIVRGAINFNLRGTNRFVNTSQIQTTFDNIPQVGFSTFRLTIAGGANGLLLVDQCPLSGKEPNDGGSTNFAMTSYQGQTTTVASPTKYTPPSCASYSVKVKSIKKCLKKRTLSFTPGIKSRGLVNYVKVYVNGKYVKKVKKSPFKVTVKLSKKLRAGKTYKYKVKVYFKPTTKYPRGRVMTRTAKFKICK